VLGYVCAIPLPPAIGMDPRWGVAGLTASAGAAGWVEFALLRRALNRRIGSTGLALSAAAKLWVAAALAAAAAWGVHMVLPLRGAIVVAAVVLGTYGAIYCALAWLLGFKAWARRLRLPFG
jgi:putative peptidoglycan lipid II flippase